MNTPYDCMNFMSYASYRHILRKMVKFWQKTIKIPLALDKKNWGFQLKRPGGGSQDEKMHKNQSVDCWPGGRPVRWGVALNTPLAPHFFTCFLWFFKGCIISTAQKRFLTTLQHFKGFRFDFWDLRFHFWDGSSFSACHNRFQLYSRTPWVFVRVCFLLVVLGSFSTSLISFFSILLMAHRKETTTSRAQGKRPAKPSQPAQMEACRRMRYDTTLFSSVEDYQRYKQKFA